MDLRGVKIKSRPFRNESEAKEIGSQALRNGPELAKIESQPLSLSEFASPETLAHLERNQQLDSAQKAVFGIATAGAAITFGVYNEVGKKM